MLFFEKNITMRKNFLQMKIFICGILMLCPSASLAPKFTGIDITEEDLANLSVAAVRSYQEAFKQCIDTVGKPLFSKLDSLSRGNITKDIPDDLTTPKGISQGIEELWDQFFNPIDAQTQYDIASFWFRVESCTLQQLRAEQSQEIMFPYNKNVARLTKYCLADFWMQYPLLASEHSESEKGPPYLLSYRLKFLETQEEGKEMARKALKLWTMCVREPT